jgi:hypothetical protein
MPGKDTSAELVLLALPHNAHTGPLEAEVEPSDSGEQRADIHTPASRLAEGPYGSTAGSPRRFESSRPHIRKSANSFPAIYGHVASSVLSSQERVRTRSIACPRSSRRKYLSVVAIDVCPINVCSASTSPGRCVK